ncbi:hypothetical protein LTR85_006698 [Meristemomyces frigidus]|nr:hypothetical protein LTR85_006698 [Meristemomyces frigidus]
MARRGRTQSNEEGDRYWQLGRFNHFTKAQLRPFLQAAGYPLKSSTTKPVMLGCAKRLERGLVCYYACSDEQLQTFARDRALTELAGRPFRRRTWVEGLMHADDEQPFERFLDLPPELRDEVYGWHMAAFPDGLLTPTQPPLCRTSRLVLRESLPVFYAECRFDVRVLSGLTTPIGLTSQSLRFVEAATKRARIGKLRFVHKRLFRGDVCTFSVTLRNGGTGKGFEVVVDGLVEKEKGSERRLEEKVRGVLGEIVGRDGNAGFRARDLFALRDAVDKGYLANVIGLLQLTTVLTRPRRPWRPTTGTLDSYWKLDDYRIETTKSLQKRARDAGYKVSSNMQRSYLMTLMHRIDRKMLCYDLCTSEERNKFGRDRGVVGSSGSPLRPVTVTHDLRGADEGWVFRRFTDLPPELRSRVYTFYMAALPDMLTTPSQPPLARTSKLIRNEALPVFYNECTFELMFVRINRRDSQGVCESILRPTQDTICFLETLTKESVEDIRNLQISLATRDTPDKGYLHPFCTCAIRLSNVGTGYSVRVQKLVLNHTNEREGKKAAVRKGLGGVLESVLVKDGKLKLRVGDIYAMRRALAAVFS